MNKGLKEIFWTVVIGAAVLGLSAVSVMVALTPAFGVPQGTWQLIVFAGQFVVLNRLMPSLTGIGRWPKLSIRAAMLALIIPSAWLAWQVHVIHERRVARQQIIESGGAFEGIVSGRGYVRNVRNASRWVPRARILMGDVSERTLMFEGPPSELQLRLADSFPEASVFYYEPLKKRGSRVKRALQPSSRDLKAATGSSPKRWPAGGGARS